MIRISNLYLPLDFDFNNIKTFASQILKIPSGKIDNVSLHKKSIDARRKDNIKFNCTIDVSVAENEQKIVRTCNKDNIFIVTPYEYTLPLYKNLSKRPLVVGFGPAGMFAALTLANAGQKPIIIERGRDVDNRTKDVNNFWRTGTLDPSSNVQFGEGGAGTFSDGKLTTGIKDKRVPFVFNEFVLNGAPREILYLSKPHIGTDNLKKVVKNIREKIISLGGEILFETQLIDIIKNNEKIAGAVVRDNNHTYEIATDNIILCIGHSARDTFKMLFDAGVKMTQKAFSVGVRIEHPQTLINKAQYGAFASHKKLGAADYKLAVHLENGRGVYTFCMCPGGSVVAAASEPGYLVTNGMSEFARDNKNSNSALLVSVTPEDFNSAHPLAGIQFQRKLEHDAFILGGKNYFAPVQLVGDFLNNKTSSSLGEVVPSYKPGYTLCNLANCLPDYIIDSLRLGIVALNKKLPGFAKDDAILTGTETRSSSPVRILRSETFESINIKGLYPCSEGAGYSGGIVSAAVDGIKCAQALLSKT